MTTHADLVLAAAHWLRREQRCTVVLTEFVSSHSAETPDAIGWRVDGRGNTWSHVVECKVSRSDLLRDASKPSRRAGATLLGNFRWYLVPAGLGVEPTNSAGLLRYDRGRVVLVRLAPDRDDDAEVTRAESPLLISALRRLKAGDQHDEKTGRFESMRNANKRRQEAAERAYVNTDLRGSTVEPAPTDPNRPRMK